MKVYSSTGRDPVQKARTVCRKKFLFYFKKGFADPTYHAWERDYKFEAHTHFRETLHREEYLRLLNAGQYDELAQRIIRIESRTNLLFSFEKMALRDAVKTTAGARSFTNGLYNYIYGSDALQQRFEEFTETLDSLPRIQTRVLTWPLHTVFGFIGNPKEHIFLKPRVTRIAAEKYGFNFQYESRPNWDTYQSLLDFAGQINKDMDVYKPVDYIDLQSFIWVMGSDEYPD